MLILCRQIVKTDNDLADLRTFALWVLGAAEFAGEDRARIAHGSWSITQTIGPQLEWHGTRADPKGGPAMKMSVAELEESAWSIMTVADLIQQVQYMVENRIPPLELMDAPDPVKTIQDELCRQWSALPTFFDWESGTHA